MSKQAQTKAEYFINNADRGRSKSQALRDNIVSLVRRRDGILNGISQANSAVNELRNRAAGGGANLDSEIRVQEEKREALNRECSRVDQDILDAENRLAEITQELEALGDGLTVKDVLAFLDFVRETEERMPRLRASIDQQRTIQREAQELDNQLPELVEQREDLLAAHAIGEATEQELNAINSAIAIEQERLAPVIADSENKIAAAEQTITGLSRLLEETTKKHQRLLEKRPLIIAAYLRSEGAAIAKQYCEAAEVLIETFTKLVAMDRLCKQLTPEGQSAPGFFAGDWRFMHLPAPCREIGSGRTAENLPNSLFATSPAQFAEKFSFEAASEIEQELAAAGISLCSNFASA